MDDSDFRSMALRQAADDEKHKVGGSSTIYFGAPLATNIVARAQVYLTFLRDTKPVVTARKPAKRKRR